MAPNPEGTGPCRYLVPELCFLPAFSVIPTHRNCQKSLTHPASPAVLLKRAAQVALPLARGKAFARRTMSLGVAKSLDFKGPTIFKIQTKPIKPRGGQKWGVKVTFNTTPCPHLLAHWQS